MRPEEDKRNELMQDLGGRAWKVVLSLEIDRNHGRASNRQRAWLTVSVQRFTPVIWRAKQVREDLIES